MCANCRARAAVQEQEAQASLSLRVGTPEREPVMDTLRNAFALGYLNEIELDERLQSVLAAVTRSDLQDITDDLPALSVKAEIMPAGSQRPAPESRLSVAAALRPVFVSWPVAVGLGLTGTGMMLMSGLYLAMHSAHLSYLTVGGAVGAVIAGLIVILSAFELADQV